MGVLQVRFPCTTAEISADLIQLNGKLTPKYLLTD